MVLSFNTEKGNGWKSFPEIFFLIRFMVYFITKTNFMTPQHEQ